MKSAKFLSLVIVVFLLVTAVSCGPYSAGSAELLSEQAPLRIKFHSSRSVDFIHLVGPFPVNSQGSALGNVEPSELWRIRPAEGRFVALNEVPSITYGVVPPGWKQEFPASGDPT